jgi:hypothetical protein
MITTCSGQQPTPQKITLTPTDWLTAGETWIEVGDCWTYGAAEPPKYYYDKKGFGKQPGEVFVGSSIVNDDNNDCFRQSNYAGAVKFQAGPSLPWNAVIQKAELKYSTVFYEYGATGIATNKKPSCVMRVDKGTQDWTGLMGEKHYSLSLSLLNDKYHAPYADLTDVVKDWIKNPSSNYGLILIAAAPPNPDPPEDWDGNVYGECYSGLGNFQLDIYYFVP